MKLSLIKDLVLTLINEHHNLDGVGTDEYHQTPLCHAMAEGKFLVSISKLVKTELLSQQHFEEMARASLGRLDGLKCETDRGVGFGLGFDWKTTKGSVPFTITSVIVADGLHEAASIANNPTPFLSELSAIKEWLTGPAIVDEVSGLPKFSPEDASIVTNVVSAWAHIIHATHPDLSALGRRFVEANFIPSVGWPYTPGNSRFDLLHTCYCSRVLLNDSKYARRIASAVSNFITPTGLIDKFDRVSVSEANELSRKSVRMLISMAESHALVLHKTPARVWSIGELLVICSVRPGGETMDGFWRSLAFHVTEQIRSVDLAVEGPRQKMHLADGLASILVVARGQRRLRSSVG